MLMDMKLAIKLQCRQVQEQAVQNVPFKNNLFQEGKWYRKLIVNIKKDNDTAVTLSNESSKCIYNKYL